LKLKPSDVAPHAGLANWLMCKGVLKKHSNGHNVVGSWLQQQARFDDFIDVFNNERPHEALDVKCPAEVYQPSTPAYKGLPDIDYPFHDKVIVVTNCGRRPGTGHQGSVG